MSKLANDAFSTQSGPSGESGMLILPCYEAYLYLALFGFNGIDRE